MIHCRPSSATVESNSFPWRPHDGAMAAQQATPQSQTSRHGNAKNEGQIIAKDWQPSTVKSSSTPEMNATPATAPLIELYNDHGMLNPVDCNVIARPLSGSRIPSTARCRIPSTVAALRSKVTAATGMQKEKWMPNTCEWRGKPCPSRLPPQRKSIQNQRRHS